MKKKNYFLKKFLLTHLVFSFVVAQRSIHRPKDPKTPSIRVSWQDDPTNFYELVDNHIEDYALFHKFDPDYFNAHLLPEGKISYRYQPDESIEGKVLRELIEDLLQEVKKTTRRRKSFKNFTILKMRDFNFRTKSGIIVVKFKNYPFVVKLFMETPQTFVQPDTKGFEQYCFFIMGGGVNRYLAGFTRLKNLDKVRTCVENDPYWSTRVDFPRKWFWQPRNNKFFEVKGININGYKEKSVALPHVYAIVCDEIMIERPFSLLNKKDRKAAIALSYFVDLRIDPHINNFLIEKDTHKIVVVDTEHFPTMIGLRHPITFKSYFSWYRQLTWRFAQEKFGRSKRRRRHLDDDKELGYLQS